MVLFSPMGFKLRFPLSHTIYFSIIPFFLTFFSLPMFPVSSLWIIWRGALHMTCSTSDINVMYTIYAGAPISIFLHSYCLLVPCCYIHLFSRWVFQTMYKIWFHSTQPGCPVLPALSLICSEFLTSENNALSCKVACSSQHLSLVRLSNRTPTYSLLFTSGSSCSFANTINHTTKTIIQSLQSF